MDKFKDLQNKMLAEDQLATELVIEQNGKEVLAKDVESYQPIVTTEQLTNLVPEDSNKTYTFKDEYDFEIKFRAERENI